MRNRVMGLLVLVLLAGSVRPAQAQFMLCWSCATEWTQLINKVQLIGIYAEQVKAYADMVKQATGYQHLPWSQIEDSVDRFEQSLQFGIGVVSTMRNADQIFRDRFPGYIRNGNVPYHVRYGTIAETLRDTLSGIIRASNQQQREIGSEAMIIYNLRQAAMGANGRNQMLQAQANLLSEVPKQIIKLRELIQADISSKAVYQAYEMQKDVATVASGEEFFNFTKEPTKSRKGLSVQ
jgi:P-type conjugative transfer protein TrbJ